MSSVIIQNIEIKHNGNVIIDTVAPNGTISINNGANYTRTEKVNISLNASDVTTGIKDISIRNININRDPNTGYETNDYEDFISRPYEQEFFWNLNRNEGLKKIEVKFRDYANNESSFQSNSSVRKKFYINSQIASKSLNLDENIIISSSNGENLYSGKDFAKLLDSFSGESIVDIEINNNVLYVLTNVDSGSKVYYLLDNEFILSNEFASEGINLASYKNYIYCVFEDGTLYKKQSSSWVLVTTFERDVRYIDGENDYLVIVYADNVKTLSIYNGSNFSSIDIDDVYLPIEADEYSSSTDDVGGGSGYDVENFEENVSSSSGSSSESSSTRENSTSSVTNSESSSWDNSQSSISISVSSSSTKNLSSSTEEEESSSNEFSSSISSPSSESFSSESYLAQFSQSSGSSDDETSSVSQSSLSSSFSSSTDSDSSTSGDVCDCAGFVDNSPYIENILLNNITTKYSSNCNLFGRIVNIGNNLIRVYLYRNADRENSDRVAVSYPFSNENIGDTIGFVEDNNSGINGSFDYSLFYNKTSPSNFVVLALFDSDKSSESSSSRSTNSYTSSESLDILLGDGTEEDPYQVRQYSDLEKVILSPSSYFILTNDIDGGCDGESSSSNYGFSPIGWHPAVPFEGVFDGRGYSVTNVYIGRPSENCVGLFGYTKNATIKNIGFIGCRVDGNRYVGGLIGNMEGGVLETSFSETAIVGVTSVGGLVGKCTSGAEIINCYSIGGVSGYCSVGGLVGFREESCSLINCYSAGSVSGSLNVGGLIGYSGEYDTCPNESSSSI